MENKKITLSLIVVSVIFALFLALGLLFVWTEITIEPTPDTAQIDGKIVNSPVKKYLLRGKHKIEIKKEGYTPIIENFSVTGYKTQLRYQLTTERSTFLSSLPIRNEKYDISYNEEYNLITGIVKIEPYQEIKEEIQQILSEAGINESNTKILIDPISGVNGRVGP